MGGLGLSCDLGECLSKGGLFEPRLESGLGSGVIEEVKSGSRDKLCLKLGSGLDVVSIVLS